MDLYHSDLVVVIVVVVGIFFLAKSLTNDEPQNIIELNSEFCIFVYKR